MRQNGLAGKFRKRECEAGEGRNFAHWGRFFRDLYDLLCIATLQRQGC
jgi:hypothetical protein